MCGLCGRRFLSRGECIAHLAEEHGARGPRLLLLVVEADERPRRARELLLCRRITDFM